MTGFFLVSWFLLLPDLALKKKKKIKGSGHFHLMRISYFFESVFLKRSQNIYRNCGLLKCACLSN